MKTYDPKKHYRSNYNFTTCYMPLGKGKVMLTVGVFGLEKAVTRRAEGDGQVFDSIEDAKDFALKKGYLVEYDPQEDLKKAIEFQKTLNKNKQPNV